MTGIMNPAEQSLRFNQDLFPIGGGRMGAAIRTFAWSKTPLGAVALWPQSLRTAVDIVVHSPVPMCLLWGRTGVMLYNDAYIPVAGSRHPVILGRSVFETWPEVADFNRRVMDAGFEGRAISFRDQHLVLHRNGRPEDVWLNLDYNPVRDEDGRPFGVLAVVGDTTRQVQATRDLRSREEELARRNSKLTLKVEARTRERDHLWNVSQDLMLVADQSGICLSVNPAWTATLGWLERELVGHGPEWLEHPDDGVRTRAELARLVDIGVTPRFENRLRHKDGSYRWISWTAVRDQGLIYAVGRDVTAEKQAQEALQATENQLRQSQKMEAVGQLTGGIAHDFNNLLTGIIGGLDIVKRRLAVGRNGDVGRFIDAAVASANRAAGLTNRLLAFSRRQTLDLKPLDLGRLLGALQDQLTRTMGERIAINLRIADDLWIAEGDANQIETALFNLAINARDAMPEGGLLTVEMANVTVDPLAARPEGGLAPGDYVVMRVRDTGVGMTPDVVTRAFDPFFTTKPMGQGTGLGLSMVYGYAKQARGHVQLDSTEGEGTTVALYVPRYSGDGPIIVPADVDVPLPVQETVLVVEDDPAVRLMVIEALRELGYTTIEAADDRAALPVLESEQQIDLLVTDVGLPGLNGRQIADFARLQRKNLRVLFITGYAEDATMRDGFLEPGMEILAKPFSMDVLTSRLKRMASAVVAPSPTRH
ncbi:PAS domain S-box protein [Bradyrhizobium sp. 2TAF24]|uniref:hybrid sensor histidine kinase/response regulator n=1 Tax=Bradyrhizobium sp. 2TAF24 TaxID=3233011 RepID=UPI003F8DA7F8